VDCLYYKSKFILYFSFLFLPFSIFAQGEGLQFEHLTVADGLPNNHIICIIQDHLGFLWFTTQNGLVKYDGYTFKMYTPEPNNPHSISTRNPFVVLEDHLGNLWISSMGEGLIKFDRDAEIFKSYTHDDNDPNSIISDEVYVLCEDNAGTLWLGMVREGMEKFNRETETFTHYRNEPDNINSLSSNVVYTITEDREGNLWVGTAFGLNKFNKETGTVIRYFNEPGNPNSLIHNQIHEIIEDKSGNIWIATAGGLSRYNSKEDLWKNYVNDQDDPNSLSGNFISFVFEDSKGKIWAGARWRGLNLLEPGTDRFIRYQSDPNNPYSINSDYIFSINEDKTGVLWIGCWLSGLNKLDPYKQKFKHYKNIPGNPNSLNNNWVWCLYTDSEGMLWIGTRGGGLNRFDPQNGTFKNYTFDPQDSQSISHNSVGSVYEDSHGNMWVGTDNGLNRFNRATGKFVRYYHNPENNSSLSNNSIMSIVEDSSNNLWIGTYGGGLNKLDLKLFDKNHTIFTRYQNNPGDPNSISYNRINTLFIDSFGDLWIGTVSRGLDKFLPESETFQHYYDRKSRFDVIEDIYEDNAGRFWVGTYNGGLNLFNRETGEREVFTQKDGLPHNSIKEILEDDFGNLWLSTERGLSKFNYEKKSFRNYTVSEGLQSGFFHMRASSRGPNGLMYFGGINGFNEFNPNKLIDNPYPPQIVITDIKLFDISLPIGGDSPLKTHINIAKEIELSYDQNDLTLEYVALHYSRSEESTYEYKLENYDKNWRKAGTHRFANYTNLEPGEYIFLVKAASSDGVWNKTPASLKIIIVPPFWQTWWFRIIAGIVFLVFLFVVHKRRVKKLEEKRKNLENQVIEKSKAAKKIQEALSEVERLKSQLEVENIYLKDEINLVHNFENIISVSDPIKNVLHRVEQVSSLDTTVLILGESGTGKELIARAIHNLSPRKDKPLIKVDCTTLPNTLIESELFGHEKGSFTGALKNKQGRFEVANGSTIFLDEIGELSHDMQAKLLRVIQDGEFERVGSVTPIKVNVRIISATNRDLEKEVQEGIFREDLYYRLNVFPIKIPPLRDRKEDIPYLVNHFITKYSIKAGKKINSIHPRIMDELTSYNWPGNVRELENVIERAIVTSPSNSLILESSLTSSRVKQNNDNLRSLEEIEKNHIINVLESTNWRVSGERGAAKILGLKPTTLEFRMHKLGIDRK